MKKILFASLVLYSAYATAQTPAMVYDGNPDKISSITGNILPYNGKIYYRGTSGGTAGLELWSYDGVSPGPVKYGCHLLSSLLSVYKGKLYFGSAYPTTGTELSSFNGTTVSLVYDINPGLQHSTPRFFTEMQGAGLLFFTADSPYSGGSYSELYRYDGVTPPMRIKVNNGSNPLGSVPSYMQAMGNYLYFSAMPGATNEYRLFRSDVAGSVTPAKGATRLSNPGEKLLVGNMMYFCATEPGTGNELYSYDGDTAIRLTDIAPGPLNGIPDLNHSTTLNIYLRNMPAVYHGLIYFCGSSDGASYQLYKFDPATGKASLVHTVNPAGDAKVGNLYVYRNALYFTAFTPATGTELWKYNDTTCVLYADVRPGPRSGMAYHYNASLPESPSYAAFTEFKGDLYFKAQDSAHGYELWRIKGPVSNVGVQQVGFNGNVSVHPNPATSAVTLDLTLQEARKLAIFVYDMSGRQVYNSTLKAYSPGSHQIGLPLQGLSAGQYVYRLNGEGGAAFATGVITKQ